MRLLKRTVIARLIVFIIVSSILLTEIDYLNKQRHLDAEKMSQVFLGDDYFYQNQILCIYGKPMRYLEQYQGVSELNVIRLSILLHTYEAYCMEHPQSSSLQMNVVEEYLASEFYADGTYRINQRPKAIEDYQIWRGNDGSEVWPEYYAQLEVIREELAQEYTYPEYYVPFLEAMTLEQLQVMFHLADEVDYIMDPEVFAL